MMIGEGLKIDGQPAGIGKNQPNNDVINILDDEDVLNDDVDHGLRRSMRVRRVPQRLRDYVLLTDEGESLTYKEAQSCHKQKLWELAMQEELKSLHQNDTWDLVPLPKGKKAIPNKWVYKIKCIDGKPKYKARLVAKGYTQVEGIDFQEVFSPVVKTTTIRVLLALVAALDLELDQMDVKTIFLHGDVNEELYMK